MGSIWSKPQILFVLPTSTFGGAERVTYNIVKVLEAFEPVLLTQEVMANFFSPLSIRTFSFEAFRCYTPNVELGNMLRYANAIRKVVDSVHPHIIFGVMHFASLFALLARDFSARHRMIPVVTSLHGTYSSHFKSVNRRPTVREKCLISYLLKRSRNIVVPSQGIKCDLVSSFKMRESKLRVIYNGFDIDWIRKCGAEDIGLEKECPWLITSSRLGPPKDFDTLLRAFKIIRSRVKAKLLILGEGPFEQSIREMSARLAIREDVLLFGFQKNPFKYIARSDIFVLSSFSEGLPSALIESMILGVPVVSTDCPSGPAEILGNNEGGLLVHVGDAEGLAQACLWLLRDRDKRMQFSRIGLERASYFSLERMKNEYEQYFDCLLAR